VSRAWLNPRTSKLCHWITCDPFSRGDAAAEHELGRRFLEGFGVASDLPAALGFFRSAADKGYGPAEYELVRTIPSAWLVSMGSRGIQRGHFSGT
jgi:TPR repeat protein